MSAIASTIQSAPEFEALKARLQATWMAGDYDVFSRFMERDAAAFFERLGLAPQSDLLDVGCGAGQLALIAARAGLRVTGCDICPNWLERARRRAAQEGLRVTFEMGDAEALPYENGRFDAVASLIGAMFAPRPERVAAELVRVCRPGGLIAMANWTPEGFVGKMFRIVSKHIAPSGMPAPVLWGDEEIVSARLRHGVAKLACVRRMYRFDYPFPPDRVVEFFRTNYGPMARAFASLDEGGQAQLRRELTGLWSDHNHGMNGATKVDAEYLEVMATAATL
jgi:SAM-dependent methyltransferase